MSPDLHPLTIAVTPPASLPDRPAFVSLVFELESGEAERLADRLIDLGALSVALEDAAAGTPAEQPLFDEPGEGGAWRRSRLSVLLAADADPALLERACAAAQTRVPTAAHREPVAERDWVRESQAQFAPVRVSARLWVVPSWCAPPAGALTVIQLDPGIAFGTGSHPTTRLCLAWLERHVRPGDTVLDYGCGSGILAIAAMKLGGARAIGVDIDPNALRASRENAERNRVACEFVDGSAPLELDVDILVANILANPLIVLAPTLAQRVRGGGRIALSGVLDSQAGEVMRAYATEFAFEEPTHEQGWTCLSGRRRTAP